MKLLDTHFKDQPMGSLKYPKSKVVARAKYAFLHIDWATTHTLSLVFSRMVEIKEVTYD